MTWSTWVSQKATEVTKRSECPALTIDRAFFVPFVLFCKHSWSRPSFLCCFDFGPGRRVPELGEAMPAQGEQGVPVGRELGPAGELAATAQAQKTPLGDIIPDFHCRLQLSAHPGAGDQSF